MHCTEQTERDLPFKILDILPMYVKMNYWKVNFTKKSNIPSPSLRNQQRQQLSSTVPCQGSKTSVSSGLFMPGLWTVRLIYVGQAGFMWCWVTQPPWWQEERQAIPTQLSPRTTLLSSTFLVFQWKE